MNTKNSNKPHICFFNSTMAWGGGEKWHFEMAMALQKCGFFVTIACNPHSVLFQKATQHQIATCAVHISNLSFLNPFKRKKLTRLFRQEAFDTIIINFPADLKIATPAAKKVGIPHIIYRRGSAIPIKNTCLNRHLFRQLTGVIANSQETKRTINHHTELFPPKHIKVIYNGMDLPAFDEKQAHTYTQRNDSSILVLGNAGRLVTQKGHFHLIDIFERIHRELPNTQLQIAGTGAMEDTLKAYAQQKGLTQSILFLGFVEDIKGFMSGLDLFLLTSLWEGFGYVITEAMACCKPVVAFDISSNPELIEHKTTGLLIPPIHIDSFARETIALLRQPAKREKMGSAARKKIERQFTQNRAIEELIDYLQQ